MKKAEKLIVFAVCALFAALALFTLVLTGCNNHFHDLIPPDENRIISFYVDGQMESAEITDDTVTVFVGDSCNLTQLIPDIEISRKATLIPLTFEYLTAAFPGIDILKERTAVYETEDITEYIMDLITRTPDFNVPPVDMPIDFTGPVNYIVVSGQGTIRQYTVNVIIDTGEPRILSLGFSKYDNPELMRDAFTRVDEASKSVGADILYPTEMTLSYELKPLFTILGEKLEVDGVEVRSGIDAIKFNKSFGIQTKKLTVWRNGISVDYNLIARIEEDLDSNNSITDFRFYKDNNPSIAATAVGSIYDSHHIGTITVQVFYSGTKPSVLTPFFLSPGTVSVNGVTQVSSVNSQNFSQKQEYRVVSRNNSNTRIYTVRVDFIDIASASPSITSFKFSSGVNPDLVQDTDAQISDSAGLIMLTARYGSDEKPDFLIPEFRATGVVTVNGSVQTSGFSGQDYTRQVKYTVSNPSNSLLSRDYWVQVTFIHDTSSDATITSFSFHPDENPGLGEEVVGRIDHIAGTISLFAPVGSGTTNRTMMPRFRAAGHVMVDDEAQISGTSGQLFNAPIVYEAVSANGANRKQYVVTVRELQTTIFVDSKAFGMADGTSWKDAFRNLRDACVAAAQFPADVPTEIWIAAGTYRLSAVGNVDESLPLAPNTSYLGGFAGVETAKSQRNIPSNRVVITGDLGGGKTAKYLFRNNYTVMTEEWRGETYEYISYTPINGTLTFENLELNSAATDGFNISNCSGSIRFNSVIMRNMSGSGINISGGSGSREFSSVNLQNISGGGISISGGSGARDFSSVTGSSIGGAAVSVSNYSSGSGNVTLTGGSFDTVGGISITASGSSVRVSGTTIRNVSGSYGLSVTCRSPLIQNVTVENVSNGSGMSINSDGTAQIVNCNIKNTRGASFGGGINLSGSGNKEIQGTTIEDVQATSYGGGIYHGSDGGSLTIYTTNIINARATRENSGSAFGGGLYFGSTAPLRIYSSQFENCVSYDRAGAISAWNTDSVELNFNYFLNCTARNEFKILYLSHTASDASIASGNIMVKNCTFTHNLFLSDPGPSDDDYLGTFFSLRGKYEDCNFTDLRSNQEKDRRVFLFNSWCDYPPSVIFEFVSSGTTYSCGRLYLTNSTFSFHSGTGSAGMLALSAGTLNEDGRPTYANLLWMDGVTIYNSGGQEPLIWLSGQRWVNDTCFDTRENLRYNGQELHAEAGVTYGIINQMRDYYLTTNLANLYFH